MRPFPPFYFIFFHVTACGRAVHQQQEAVVLVLRKYHKAEIFTYIADTGALSSSQQLGLETRSRHTKILSLPSGIKVRKQNTSLKIKLWKEGLGGDFPSPVPVLSTALPERPPSSAILRWREGSADRGGSTTALRFGRGAKFSAFREKLLMLWHLCCSYRSAMVWFS